MTRDESGELYRVMVCYGKPSVALSLLLLWDRPWSPAALRYAYWALVRALAHGCDVLDAAVLANADGSPRYSAAGDTSHDDR